MRFLFFSEYGEILDLALHVARKHEVAIYIKDKASKSIGRGMLPHVDNWFDFMGKGVVWVFDSCSFGRLS